VIAHTWKLSLTQFASGMTVLNSTAARCKESFQVRESRYCM
jgi:hypothetical protein